MSDEEETCQDDVEYVNTQKEIEGLRRREEELMLKMNAIESKRKSMSENSFDEREFEKHDEMIWDEEQDEDSIGKRRRPSLSRGSSKSSDGLNVSRPKSLHLENESGTFRSRSNRSSSSSPTKETRSSATSSRTSLTSPTKEQVYSSRSKISIKQSGSPSKSQAKSPSGHGYRISMTSSSEKVSISTKNDRPTATSRAKMQRSYSASSAKKSPRGSNTDVSKNAKKSNRRSFTVADDSCEAIEDPSKAKANSTTNLTSVDVPENNLSDRGIRGSRDSCREERSRSSIKINDDSYEIIEIHDDEEDMSLSEDQVGLTAREKIEKELAEQKQREEELQISHMLSSSLKKVEKTEEAENNDREGNSDGDEEQSDEMVDGSMEEEDESKAESDVAALSTWEKIALEIEEEKRREEEARTKNKKEEDEFSSKEDGDEGGSDAESDTVDVSTRITQEIEDQARREQEARKTTLTESDSNNEEEGDEGDKTDSLTVQDRIELEIKEIEKRENELRKQHNLDDGEEEEEGAGTEEEEEVARSPSKVAKSKIQQEIDEFKEKESEFRKLHGVDELNGSDDDDNDGSNTYASLSVIEREMVEQRKKEQEFRRQHMHLRPQEEDGGEEEQVESIYDEEEIPEDESTLISRTDPRSHGEGRVQTTAAKSSELTVAPGITKKFIHLFDGGSDKSGTRKADSSSKAVEKRKVNGRRNSIDSDGYDDEVHEEDGNAEKGNAGNESDFGNEQSEEEISEEIKQVGIDAPPPGKKLVLKRKKSKDRRKEGIPDESTEKELKSSAVGKIRGSDGRKVGIFSKYFRVVFIV